MNKAISGPIVKTFFDETTFTAQYVVHDPATGQAAIIDPVLDFDSASGQISQHWATRILQYGQAHDLTFVWILETHAHADHLSAAGFLADQTGAVTAIGAGITKVQRQFRDVFDFEANFSCDGAQFGRLLSDGDILPLGDMQIRVLATPGHTPACNSFAVDDALFVGDTIFMPDYGSARADFPGGDAAALFTSVQRLYEFADETRMFLCHDYKAQGRDKFVNETSVGVQKRENIHIKADTNQADFVQMRTARDKTLSMPKLILPALQVNLRGGRLPPAADNGISYLKLPLNQFTTA
ncbi:MBL-fold metallo-hydrolase superfamily [hydrothermal vent metagenome]|uniref:MBL-fold metallo-hydrolase superfamily n=1 Tax=hydrothermal vent metagenome TaxID=652676 RepID=A0A3B0RRH3_9ZZZZ